MNRSDLINNLARKNNISVSESTAIVNTFFNSIKESLLNGDRVEIRSLFTMQLKKYGSYIGRNPQNGESVNVLEKVIPVFKAGKMFKKYINS